MLPDPSYAPPLVSVLINNYNYGQFLADAIDSVLKQTYPHIEIIVVDDGSIDHSREVIARYQGKIIPVLKENGGQASAFNAGFAASQGEIICFLDADDIYLPNKVTEIVQLLHPAQESSWCFHMLQFRETDLTTRRPGHYDHQDSGLVQACDLRAAMRQGSIRGKLPFSIPATSGLCFTRSLLQQILPMPEAAGIGLNDSYLQFTALALAPGFALSKILSCQRVHPQNHFTRQADRKPMVARISCLTAYWLRGNFPFLAKFADKFFALGLSAYWHMDVNQEDICQLVGKYLTFTPLTQKLRIYARAIYYYFAANYQL